MVQTLDKSTPTTLLSRIKKLTASAWSGIRTTLGQGITGFAALIALTIFLWPADPWKFEPSAFFAFAIAIAAWLASLTSSGPASNAADTEPSAHDLALLNKLRELITESTRRTLFDHDFGASFRWSRLDPISELANWQGAEHEFDNAELQSRLEKVIKLAEEFIQDLALNSNLVGGSSDWASVPNDEERSSDWHSTETRAKTKQLNEKATALGVAIDGLIKFARVALKAPALSRPPNQL